MTIRSTPERIESVGRLVDRPTPSLRPHPAYQELCGPIAATRVRRVAQQAQPIREPLLTTTDGTILDGHARWQVAMNQGQPNLPCIECAVTEDQALQLVVQRHRSSEGLNAYGRIVLALGLEAHLRARRHRPALATGNQQPSSNLTNNEYGDVRRAIADVAGVSTGNVTKVKQILGQCDSGSAGTAPARGGQHPSGLAVAHADREGAARCPCGSICTGVPSRTPSAVWSERTLTPVPQLNPSTSQSPSSLDSRCRPRRAHGGDCGCSRTSRGGNARVLRRAAGEAHPMTPALARPLRDVLETHRDEWDHDDTRPSVREAFAKVVDCGTEALGAEVFASDDEERVVYHTCKSRACPSCGYQATRAWQRDQWRELPDVPYAHVCLTHAGCALAAVPAESASPP